MVDAVAKEVFLGGARNQLRLVGRDDVGPFQVLHVVEHIAHPLYWVVDKVAHHQSLSKDVALFVGVRIPGVGIAVFEYEILLAVFRISDEYSHVLVFHAGRIEGHRLCSSYFLDIEPAQVRPLVGGIAYGRTAVVDISARVHDRPVAEGVVFAVVIVGAVEIGEPQRVAKLVAKHTHAHERAVFKELVAHKKRVEVHTAHFLVDVDLAGPYQVGIGRGVRFGSLASAGIENAHELHSSLLVFEGSEIDPLCHSSRHGIAHKAFNIGVETIGIVGPIVFVAFSERDLAHNSEGGFKHASALRHKVVLDRPHTVSLFMIARGVVKTRHLFLCSGLGKLSVAELDHNDRDGWFAQARHRSLGGHIVFSQSVLSRGNNCLARGTMQGIALVCQHIEPGQLLLDRMLLKKSYFSLAPNLWVVSQKG